jgi:multidrug efflux pump subunit AcrB
LHCVCAHVLPDRRSEILRPLAEAVVFAMMASYLLSRTLIPTLVMFFLKNHEHEDKFRVGTGFFAPFKRFQIGFERRFEQLRDAYHRTLRSAMDHRALFVTSFLLFCILSIGLVFFLGQDFFPSVDAGIFRMHVRGTAGLHWKRRAYAMRWKTTSAQRSETNL